MKTILKTTMVLTIAATLFTGCSVEDMIEDTSEEIYTGSGSSSHNDTLSVVKTGEGFLVMWTKRASSYGEVIYTDSLSKERGNGYPLTANATGTYTMPCTMGGADSQGANFSCNPSNVSNSKSVYLKSGVEYKWLVGYGFDHEHGEVEATMEFSNGVLTIE